VPQKLNKKSSSGKKTNLKTKIDRGEVSLFLKMLYKLKYLFSTKLNSEKLEFVDRGEVSSFSKVLYILNFSVVH
jgi:hypothetical protein